MNPRTRSKLLECFKAIPHALRFGDFTLSSGKKASYYVDARRVTLNSDGLMHITCGMFETMEEFLSGTSGAQSTFDTIGGMQTGADPIVGGVLVMWKSWSDNPLDGFLWRKEAKTHGTQQQYEGTIRLGAKIVLVDDVATTGGSLLEVADKVKQLHAAEVIAALVVVDRLEGASEALLAQGIPLYSLLTKDDLLAHQG